MAFVPGQQGQRIDIRRLEDAFAYYASTNRFAYYFGFDRPSRDVDPFAEKIEGVGILSREELGVALRARPKAIHYEAPLRDRATERLHTLTSYVSRTNADDAMFAHDYYASLIAAQYLHCIHVEGGRFPLRDIADAHGIRLEHRPGAPALIEDVGFFDHERDIALVLAWDAMRREQMPCDERIARLIAAHILAQRAEEAMKESVATYERSVLLTQRLASAYSLRA